MSNTDSNLNALRLAHKQWSLNTLKKFRFHHPELQIDFYEDGWNFTFHVKDCPEVDFVVLQEELENIRPVTCNINLSKLAPTDKNLISEEQSYQAELWLNGEPHSSLQINNLLYLAEPSLPYGYIDYERDTDDWVYYTVATVTDFEKNKISNAVEKIGILGDVRIQTAPEKFSYWDDGKSVQAGKHQGKLALITSRTLVENSVIRHLVEQDEDYWRGFLNKREKQIVENYETHKSQNFSCLYDVKYSGESRLSELLTIYDQVNVIPPVGRDDEWLSRHQVSLSDLQELVHKKRVRLILPYSVTEYSSALIEAIAEADHSGMVLSRALAIKTIESGQAKEPLLYAPFKGSERLALMSVMSSFFENQKVRALLKAYAPLLANQHHFFMHHGALALLHSGVGAYLGNVFYELANKDARLEFGACGAGVEWALGLGAAYIPRDFGEYDETHNSLIIASFLSRTKFRLAEPTTNRMHTITNGLLSVTNVPPIEVARNFESASIARFRELARKLMRDAVTEAELQLAIEGINADVQSFERRKNRLVNWKLDAVLTTLATGSIQESLGAGIFASALSAWIYEILKSRAPACIGNNFSDLINTFLGLVISPSHDVVVVSRSRSSLGSKSV